jgi:hypothetical protein
LLDGDPAFKTQLGFVTIFAVAKKYVPIDVANSPASHIFKP